MWGAARVGDPATLRYLLANGGGSSWTPSKDDEVWGRDTCLGVASRFGHEGAVEELLESGVRFTWWTRSGQTTGSDSALHGCTRRTRGRGRAAPEGRGGREQGNDRTMEALRFAFAAEEGHEGVVEQLLKAKADVNKAKTDRWKLLRFTWLHKKATRAWLSSS